MIFPPRMLISRSLSISMFASLTFVTFLTDAQAFPKYVRLSFTGDTSTTMTVTWNTDAQEGTEVRFGTGPGKFPNIVQGTSFQATAGLGFIHEVTLTGLTPNTVYYYIAGAAGGAYSAESSFKTGPVQHETCGSLMFAYLGDNRPDPTFGGGQNWAEILEQSDAHNPAFDLNGGDLVTDGDNLTGWLDFLKWTEKSASRRAFMPSIGNHDNGPGEGDTANYNQLFTLPRSEGGYGSGTEDYYYFTYGNAIFAALSTEGFKGGTIPFGNQAAWLDEVLTNNPRKWKFVFYHKPSYTKEVIFDISHAPNEEGQNAALVAVLDKHHVDIVFTSHNHWYERFEPTACGNEGKPGSDQPCPAGGYAKGTVYVVSGGAGAFTIPGFLCGSMTGRGKCSGDHHYVLVDISNEKLRFETWSAYPQANEVIDSFEILKTADPCSVVQDGGYPDAGKDAGASDASADAASGDAAMDSGAGPDVVQQPDAAASPDGSGADGGAQADGGQTGSDSGGPEEDDVGGGDESASISGCGCSTVNEDGLGSFPMLVLTSVLVGICIVWSLTTRRRSG